MVCYLPLSQIGNLRLLALFGGNFSVSKAALWLSIQLINHNLMGKPRPSISALRHTSAIMWGPSLKLGVFGCPWQSGGTTPATTVPLATLCLKPSTAMPRQPSSLMYRAHQQTWQSIPSCGIARQCSLY